MPQPTKQEYEEAHGKLEEIYASGDYDDDTRDAMRTVMDWLEAQADGGDEE